MLLGMWCLSSWLWRIRILFQRSTNICLIKSKSGVRDNAFRMLHLIYSLVMYVIGYTPVTGGFHAKKACNGREYEYWLPTYTLEMPPARSLQLRSSRDHPSDLYIAEENAYIPVSTRENIAEKHQCRISNSKLDQFRDAMAVFQGTHNFHNYTIQRNASDPSANRYIMRVEVRDSIYYSTGWLILWLGWTTKAIWWHGMGQCQAPGTILHVTPDPKNDCYGHARNTQRHTHFSHFSVIWASQNQHSKGTCTWPLAWKTSLWWIQSTYCWSTGSFAYIIWLLQGTP